MAQHRLNINELGRRLYDTDKLSRKVCKSESILQNRIHRKLCK